MPALYVTHDQTEALSMSDRVIVMNAGHVMQEGRPEELYHRPINRFVADFIGDTNFLPVRREGGQWLLPDGTALMLDAGSGGGEDPVALLRPEAIGLAAEPAGLADGGVNRLSGTVLGSAYLGPCIEYVIGVGGTRIRAFSRQALLPGSTVALTFTAADCRLIEPASNLSNGAAPLLDNLGSAVLTLETCSVADLAALLRTFVTMESRA